MRKALAQYPFVVGLVVRLIVAVALPWILDTGRLIPGVAYTDIDFHVYSDAARHIQQGGNPFDRATYRYTPFLAALLARLPTRESARYLFCIADAACGWLIVALRRQQRKQRKRDADTDADRFQDALWWMYNPLAINICTRGSAESGLVLLPVLLVVWVATATPSQLHRYLRAVLAGACHGVAIHAKLYPIIYTLSFATNFVDDQSMQRHRFPVVTSGKSPSVFILLLTWARRLLSPAPVLFGLVSMVTFVGLTYASVLCYGGIALQEGLLYHFSRVDHRHNYSLHWYWIYLARAAVASSIPMTLVGRLLLVPQLVLLVYASLGVAPHNLPLALFLQTFLFVAHNKVITAQYFTWYLCLLPLCSDQFRWQERRVRVALGVLLGSIGLWLGSAYCLEMQGMAVHRLVWVASSVFFVANIHLLGALLASTRVISKEQGHIYQNKTD